MPEKSLEGRNVLVITTNHGTEQSELQKPVAALRGAGARVTVAARTSDDIETVVSDRGPGERIRPDTTFAEVSADDYDAVVVPGGTVNADRLRIDHHAQRLVSAFADAGKVVAAICHGPWLLVDSGLAAGRELTSYPTLRADLSNAGGTWVDREVVIDDRGGYRLITSRRPRDLDRFAAAVAEALRTR
ncbi:type 1 glutamine amidotransferase domain-containing protein [Streptomyces solicathayae]|uniref:Type 1 glutamine amidotransferase domain-containing protein n=1 Tax=Streptomyces solicathayae TaxID=3081768 RepID=A0ABZ0LL40_9ACTN|nr:type 1 glutamine amidotransferase domain-containing protein [Streptomyces sp. HUAS YS2]WOX20230.1 type 1 glutamine amidotransferase domain-containing protein [Streptomyces sp. HUAS YS2]